MILNHEQALHVAKVYEDYFGNFNRIDEYMRDQKLNSLMELPTSLPGCGIEVIIPLEIQKQRLSPFSSKEEDYL